MFYLSEYFTDRESKFFFFFFSTINIRERIFVWFVNKWWHSLFKYFCRIFKWMNNFIISALYYFLYTTKASAESPSESSPIVPCLLMSFRTFFVEMEKKMKKTNRQLQSIEHNKSDFIDKLRGIHISFVEHNSISSIIIRIADCSNDWWIYWWINFTTKLLMHSANCALCWNLWFYLLLKIL